MVLKSLGLVMLALGVGCGGASSVSETIPSPNVEPSNLGVAAVVDEEPAPWNIAALSESEVPTQLVDAWQQSDNRNWCGLVSFHGPDLSSAQVTAFDGGWSVEFAGDASFGLVGSAINTDAEDPGEAEERRFRDGSVLRYEPALGENESARVASIRIAGQDCLYQVWSMEGDAHLEQLVSSLRRVGDSTTATSEGQALAAE